MQSIVSPRPRWTFLLSFAGSWLLPPLLTAQQPERYSISGDEIAIYNLAGEVRVEPGQGSAVITEVTRGGAEAAKLKVEQGKINDRSTLRLVYPADRILYGKLSNGSSTQLRVRGDGTFSDEHGDENRGREGRKVTIAAGGGGFDAHADLRILVPANKRVAVYLAAGKVAVNNVHGELYIDVASAPVTTAVTRGELHIGVGSGAVQVRDARGDLSVDTGAGAVAVSDIRGETVEIETGSGDVTVSDIRTSQLSIETGSGEIKVASLTAPQVSLETGSGSVTADLSGDLWNVNVETGSGDITLKVPPTLAAEVDIETSSGNIETDFEVAVTRHARDHLTGRIGDGGGKIDIETGSGGIKLVKKGA